MSTSILSWRNTALILFLALAVNLFGTELPAIFLVPSCVNNALLKFGLPPLLKTHPDLPLTYSEAEQKSQIQRYLKSLNAAPITDEQALEYCPLSPVLAPEGYEKSYAYFGSSGFRDSALKVLKGAVDIPTESFDGSGPVGEDPVWDIFYKFEEYLKETFPAVHKHLELEHANTHGLVYTWKGKDASLKPVMLAAHQDVVPVLPETRDLWTHDPYDAHFDGQVLWGRGTADDKSPLIGILQAIEYILTKEPGYVPSRTIIAAFGFDEESGGKYGAKYIMDLLLAKYGSDSFEAILDEGGQGVHEYQGVKVAIPGVTEKGTLTQKINLHTNGGHSSMPPDHTAIGIIAALAKEIEDTPFTPLLSTNYNPFFKFLKCIAARSPLLGDHIRQVVFRADQGDPVALELVTKYLLGNRLTKYSIQTSQALDIIHGGLKSNSLPEEVSVVINFRVSIDSSVEATRKKVFDNTLSIAKKYGVGIVLNETLDDGTFAVSEVVPKTKVGYFTISDYREFFEPAKVSSTEGPTWDTYAGSLRQVYQKFAGPIINPVHPPANFSAVKNDLVVVAPGLMTGNTDTKHYWDLSDNIYRFSPMRLLDRRISNIHTVDEHLSLDVHLETIVFYYTYIKNLQ